jgi:hypothetical protein
LIDFRDFIENPRIEGSKSLADLSVMNRIAPPLEHAVVPHPDLGPKPSLKLVLGATLEQQGSRIKNQSVRTRCVGQLLRTPLANSFVRTFVSNFCIDPPYSGGKIQRLFHRGIVAYRHAHGYGKRFF